MFNKPLLTSPDKGRKAIIEVPLIFGIYMDYSKVF